MQLCVWRQPKALSVGGDNASDKGAMSQSIIQCFLIRPIGTFFDTLEMRVRFGEASIKNSNFDPST